MTTLSTPRFAAAAAFASLVLLGPVPDAEAKSGGSVKSATSTHGYKPPPVVRDHRKSPKPWSLPPRYHRH